MTDLTPVPRDQVYTAAVVPWTGPHETQQPVSHNPDYAVSVGPVPGGVAVVTPSGCLFSVEVYACRDWAIRRAQQLGWEGGTDGQG